MHPTTKIDVVDDGISSILKKYKEIRSELLAYGVFFSRRQRWKDRWHR